MSASVFNPIAGKNRVLNQRPRLRPYGNPVSPYYGGPGHKASPTAETDKNAYVSGQIGWNNPVGNTRNLDNDVSYSGALGYQVNPYVRIEGELSYRSNEFNESGVGYSEKTTFDNTGVMLNFWYDIPTETKLTPYFGGGIGAMYGSIKSAADDGTFFVDVDDSDLVFAYQLGAGLAYALNDSWVLTADYRYLDTGNYKVEGSVNGVNAGHVDVGDCRRTAADTVQFITHEIQYQYAPDVY